MASLFPERIETDRLVLELLHESVDPLEFYRICSSDPDIEAVTEYLAWEPHATPKETVEFLDHVADQYRSDDGAHYVVRPKEGDPDADEIAGATGLTVDWEHHMANLGLWLRERFWGRGYSGERAAALIEVVFERLDLGLVAVSHVEGNDRSKRAIEKYVNAHGGGYDGVLRNWDASGDEPRDVHRYTVTRDQYERTG